MAERRLGLTRRKSLADVAEEWSDACYVLYRPASYRDMLEVRELNTATSNEREGINFILDFTKRHFASGKIIILDDDDNLKLVDMTANDIDQLPPEAVNALFADITGAKLDPKDTRLASTDDPQPTDEADTEMQSSTDL